MPARVRSDLFRAARLGGVLLAAVAAAFHLEPSQGAPQSINPANVALTIYDASGNPVPSAQLRIARQPEGSVTGVFALDKDYEPQPYSIASVSDGIVELNAPLPSPLILHFFPRVEGFGRVKVYVDNGGEGYTRTGTGRWVIDLPLEAAKSRVHKTTKLMSDNTSVSFRSETISRHNSAKQHLDVASAGSVNPSETYKALSDALWAGEMAAVDVAKAAILRAGRRSSMKFGILVEDAEKLPDNVKGQIAAMFNYATCATFFHNNYEAVKGVPKTDVSDAAVAWLSSFNLEIKGHPLVYLESYAIPSWLKGADYSTLETAYLARINREVTRFKGKIKGWDVLNEGHTPNGLYSQTQIVQLAKVACQAVKQADPAATRVINVTLVAGDYVVSNEFAPMVRTGMTQTPMKYLKALIAAGVDFDAIGVEMYYPALDMMEISRVLDRFASFGKPIYITELGVSSRTGVDSQSNAFASDDFSVDLGEWHKPWDEATQADWIEQFYTIAYSKSAIQAITYTHMPDLFWPYGGLLRRDLSPKPSYTRLKDLLLRWGFQGAKM